MSDTTAILISLLTTGRVAELELSRALRSIGLNATDYQLLWHLSSSPAISAAHLAREAGISRQVCRRALDHLESCELIELTRNRDDRRATEYHLTAQGQSYLGYAAIYLSDIESRLSHRLATERDELLRLLSTARAELPESLRLPWWDWPIGKKPGRAAEGVATRPEGANRDGVSSGRRRPHHEHRLVRVPQHRLRD